MNVKEILQIQVKIKKIHVLNIFQAYPTLMQGMYRLVEHLLAQAEGLYEWEVFKLLAKELPNELRKDNLKQTLYLIILHQQCLIHIFDEMSQEFKNSFIQRNNLAIKTLKQIVGILFKQLSTISNL